MTSAARTISSRAFGRDSESDNLSTRIVYQKLHEILVVGIEANHFRQDREAISFVSSLFSYAMSNSFMHNLFSELRMNYSRRDPDAFASRFRILIGNLIDRVRQDSVAIGVSNSFLNEYFNKNNSKNIRTFSSNVMSINLDKTTNEKEYLTLATKEFIEFMEKSLNSSKDVTYKRRALDKIDVLYSVIAATMVFSVTVMLVYL